MSSAPIVALRDLSFSYDSAQESLITHLSVHFPIGFTGIHGANGSGKTTLLELISGSLAPGEGASANLVEGVIEGFVEGAGEAVYCEQRTDTPPHKLLEFLEDWDGDACELRSRLGIQLDWLAKWDCLSHGERKRAQIATALWQEPELLAIDEPTNHIDSHARDLLITSLRQYRGVGLIVSHDRELLDLLCIQCLWLEPPSATLYQGGFTQARQQMDLDRGAAIRQREKIVRDHKRLEREVKQRREQASREHQLRSKRGLAKKDSDAREKIDRARVADSKAGRSLRQLDGRAEQLETRLQAASLNKEYQTGIWIPGACSRRDQLFEIEPGGVEICAGRELRFPRLTMKPDDRIAITGVNGAGKSTLVQHIIQELNVSEEKVVYIPQEVTASAASVILDEARSLRSEELGQVMNIVSRLGSRPNRLLESQHPSPGEIRKLLLALGMSRAPHLIVLDEPTNHLDLPSIEALETALSDCPCGLLLVSHDQRFLERLGVQSWLIEVSGDRLSELRVD